MREYKIIQRNYKTGKNSEESDTNRDNVRESGKNSIESGRIQKNPAKFGETMEKIWKNSKKTERIQKNP